MVYSIQAHMKSNSRSRSKDPCQIDDDRAEYNFTGLSVLNIYVVGDITWLVRITRRREGLTLIYLMCQSEKYISANTPKLLCIFSLKI